MKKPPLHSQLRNIALLIAADVLYFTISNPTRGGSAVIVLACVLVALNMYVCTRYLILCAGWLLRARLKHERLVTLTLTITGVFLLLMQSLGQLALRDVFVVIPLAVVLYFYMSHTLKHKDAKSGSVIRVERG